MSLHSSLKVDKAGVAARTVLSRVERLKEIIKKGEWTEDHEVTNLPKTKAVRVKAGKKKAKEEGAPVGAAGATGAPAPAAKGAAAKGAAVKAAPAKK